MTDPEITEPGHMISEQEIGAIKALYDRICQMPLDGIGAHNVQEFQNGQVTLVGKVGDLLQALAERDARIKELEEERAAWRARPVFDEAKLEAGFKALGDRLAAGWKKQSCAACGGAGGYDQRDHWLPCDACNGKGF